jgi:hypothetical protein
MVCCRGFLPIWYMLKQDPWTLLEQMYIYWIMISLHTWVVRLISKYLWLLALQHINSTLKAQLLLIWSSFSWTESPPTVTEGHDRVVCSPASCVSNRGRQHFELIWFELNRVTPHYHRGTWSGCVFPSQLCFKPRKTTLWVDLVWVEPSHPPLSPRDMIGLCVPQSVVFQTEGDNTLSWSGLSWFDLVRGLQRLYAYGGPRLMCARGMPRPLLGGASLWCLSHAKSTRSMTRLLSFSPLELFSGVPESTHHQKTNRSKTYVWNRWFEWPLILVRLSLNEATLKLLCVLCKLEVM